MLYILMVGQMKNLIKKINYIKLYENNINFKFKKLYSENCKRTRSAGFKSKELRYKSFFKNNK